MQFDDVDSMYYLTSNSAGVMREDDGLYAYNFSILSFGNVSSTIRIWC